MAVRRAARSTAAVPECPNQRLSDLQRTISALLQSAHERQRQAEARRGVLIIINGRVSLSGHISRVTVRNGSVKRERKSERGGIGTNSLGAARVWFFNLIIISERFGIGQKVDGSFRFRFTFLDP